MPRVFLFAINYKEDDGNHERNQKEDLYEKQSVGLFFRRGLFEAFLHSKAGNKVFYFADIDGNYVIYGEGSEDKDEEYGGFEEGEENRNA